MNTDRSTERHGREQSAKTAKSQKFAEDLDPLLKAIAIQDTHKRNSAYKQYYFPNPSAPYEYALVYVNAFVAFALLVFLTVKLAGDSHQLVISLALVPVAFFFSDFMSALFHKFLDSFASEANPFWGNAAKAFRIHHEFQANHNETTYLHNVSAFAPFMTVLLLLTSLGFLVFNVPLPIFFMLLIMFVLFANGTEIHKQAHRQKRSWVIRFLQTSRIFLSHKAHRSHHIDDHNRSYAIINGWSNGILNRLDVWNLADQIAWRGLGIFPRNWIHDPESIPANVQLWMSRDPSLRPLEIDMYAQLIAAHKDAQDLRVGKEGKKPSRLILAK